MSSRSSVVLRRALFRGPAVVLVPVLVAGSIVAASGPARSPREDRPRTKEVSTAPAAGEFVPLTPSRVLDTRTTSQPFAAAEIRPVPLLGSGGVPTAGVSAVVVVVTAVSPTSAGYLTMYPYGISPRPVLSHVYFSAGENAANTVIAKLGTDGKVNVYNSAGSTHLLVDVTGYYTSGSTTAAGGTFVALAPARIYSTPDGLNTDRYGTTPYGADETRTVQITGNGGVPTGAAAVAVNIHASTTTPTKSYVQVWPAGTARPTGSNVQLAGNDTQRGLAVVKLSADGRIQVYNNGSTVPIKLDVEGYYLPATSDAAKYYVPLNPARIFSTTLGLNTPGGSTAKLGAGATLSVGVRGAKDAAGNVVVPATTAVDAVVVSVGTGSPTAASYLTAWTNGETRPITSMSVYNTGENRSATVFGKLGDSGKIDVYNHLGSVSVSVEVQGYFADAAVLRPMAPTGLAAAPGNGSVALTWTAAVDNGFPLTGNTVTVTDAAGVTVATYDEPPGAVARTVPNLVNGAAYVFAVTARNEAGPGPAASTGPITPVGPPTAPANVVAVPGNRTLDVRWQAAGDGGTPVTGQFVTIRRASDDGQVVQALVAADATTRSFNGLTNGVAYYAEVVATNGAGTGPAGRSPNATPVYPDEAPYATAVTADSPTVYYRLGESSGTVAADASGFARNGTYVSAPALGATGALPGDIDTAVTVTGGSRVQYKDAAGLPIGNAPRSVEAWIKTTSTVRQQIAGWGSDLPGQRFFLSVTNGDRLTLEVSAAQTVEHSLPAGVVGSWHHVALTYSGAPENKTVVYLDGRAVASATVPGGLSTVASAEYLVIGREPNSANGPFIGGLDEVAIYDTALPADRVAAHFAASRVTTPLPPQNSTAAAGEGFVTTDWDATSASVPAGQPAVDGYVVEVTAGGVLRGRIRTGAAARSARVSGLPQGEYVVTVRGCNVYGCGLAGVSTVTVHGAGATYASLVLDDAPLAYLRLGERSGTEMADSSPHRRDAVLGGKAVLGAAGAIGGDPDPAIRGAGTDANALARTRDAVFLPTGTAARTLQAWVKGSGAVASWGTNTTGRAFGVRVTGTSFVVTGFADDVTLTTPVSVADGGWHHVAVTFDGSTVTGYFDGVAVGSGTFPTAPDTATSGLLVGLVPGDAAARTAAVDDVAVFDRVLTAERISTYHGAAVLAPKYAVDPPAQMAVPRVVAADAGATVTWTEPADRLGLLRYEVTVRNRSDGSVHAIHPVMAGGTSATIAGLRAGAAYVFTVRAVNNLGAGPESLEASATIVHPLATGLPVGPDGPTRPNEFVRTDQTWGPAHSPYIVSDLYVEPGATLTLLPGTVVKVQDTIFVKGQLVAAGTAASPVVFTSWQDDSVGGDSTGDGPSAGARHQWNQIKFDQNGNLAPRVSVLDHVEIRYGGGSGGPTTNEGVVQTDGFAKVVVSNSRIHANIGGVGVKLVGPSGTGWTSVTHNVFTENHYGVRTEARTDVVGNLFAAANVSNDEAAALRFNYGATDVLVAYNDLHMPIGVFADLRDDKLVITRNNFWASFTEAGDFYFPAMAENYWGRALGAVLPIVCVTEDEADDHFPPLYRDPSIVSSCPIGTLPAGEWLWYLGETLDAPIATTDTAAAADDAAPMVGPVDVARGILRYEVTDIELSDAGQALRLQRVYRSNRGDGILGRGWNTNYSASLRTEPNGTRSVDVASGATLRFQTTGAPEPGVPATMELSGETTMVTSADSSSYEFDAQGALTALTLRDPDHRVELTRANGVVTAVTGVSGRRITFGYSGGTLSGAADSANRDVAYTVDAGLLRQARGVGGGAERYGYDAGGRLDSITTPEGRVILRAGYDAEGRVAWYEQGGSGRTTMEYHAEAQYTVAHRPDGVDMRFEYDRYHRLVRQVVVGGRTDHVTIGVGSAPGATITGIPAEGATGAPQVTATRLDWSGAPVEEVDGEGRVVRTTFDSKARPLVTTYGDGGRLVRHYDAKGRVDSVTDPAGKTWSAEYNGFGQPTRITDPLGRHARTTYFANGDLHEEFDAGGLKTTFTPDAVGRVAAVTDPRGKASTTTYTAWNAVATTTTPRGARTMIAFDLDRNPIGVTAPEARASTFGYDMSGRLTSITDPEGAITTLDYDSMSRVRTVHAPRGAESTRTFTADGEVLTATDPLGKTTTYAYDSVGNVASVTDETGVVTSLTYDRTSRQVTRKVGQQGAERRTYDAKGRLATITSPRGGVVTTTYDKLDRTSLVHDSVRGPVFAQTFDDAGRVLASTDALGNVTTYGYDASDRVESAVDKVGRVFFRVFDDAGRLVSDKNGRDAVTTYAYDDDGNIATVTAADGGVTLFETDLAGRVRAVVDAKLRRTEADYDKVDRVVERRHPDLTKQVFGYDDAGNLESRTDRAGFGWLASYDLAGRLRSTTSPEGALATYEYDGAGRPTLSTDADGVVERTEYDTSGRPFRVTDTAGAAWLTTYGVDALPASETDPDGVKTVFGYDGAGRVNAVTDALGKVTTMTHDAADNRTLVRDALGHATTWDFDDRGRLEATVNGQGERVGHGYDLAGNRTSTVQPDLTPTTYTYDPVNRIDGVTDGEGKHFAIGYDLAGQRETLTLPGGGVWRWTYDTAGRVDTEQTPMGEITGFDYDGEGRLSQIRRPSGRTTTITVDKEGRVRREQALDGTWRARTYSPAGRLRTASSPAGATEWAYDSRGLLAETVDAGGVSTTSYTPGQRVQTRSTHGRAATTATYNTRGLLASLTGAIRQTYEYDDARRLAKIRYASPEIGVERFGWDGADRLLSREQLATDTATTPQLRLAYEYDVNGRVRRFTQAAPSRNVDRDATFTYDGAGRLKTTAAVSGGEPTTVAFGWDADGNRESVTTTVAGGTPAAVTYSFDLSGQLTGSSDGSAYTHDDDGNLVGSTGVQDVAYTYDGLGALATATVPAAGPSAGHHVAYARDGLGRMAGRTADGVTSSFAYDGLSLDVAELASGGDVTTFVRDPHGDLAGVVNGAAVSHAVLNGHTDVAGLVSASTGAVSAFAAYDAFGVRSGDVAALPLGYQSDYTDPVTGLVDMGARSYAPWLGRFTALDDVVGDPMQPGTFNRFLYGTGDPFGFTDPDGHRPNPLQSVLSLFRQARDGVREFNRVVRMATARAMDHLRRGVNFVTGGFEAARQLATGMAGEIKSSIHEGLVRPVLDELRSNAFARVATSTLVGVAVTGACGLTTFGVGSVACLAAGEVASSALDSYLTCPADRSGGDCAVEGAVSGLASGVAFGIAGRSPASRLAAGALAGAVGSAAGQLATTGRVDRARAVESAVAGVATAGLGVGVARVGRSLLRRTNVTGANGPDGSVYGHIPLKDAGGDLLNLDWRRARVTSGGVDVVERHLRRFVEPGDGLLQTEQFMLDRLRKIAAGHALPSSHDLRFYTHELREFVRYRKQGYHVGLPTKHDVDDFWNAAHTATLNEYGMQRGDEVRLLYDPSVKE